MATFPDFADNELIQLLSSGLKNIPLQTAIEALRKTMQGIYPQATDFYDDNSPDGQLTGTLGQAVFEFNENIIKTNNGMNPLTAVGTQLDDVVAICNLTRSPATYTFQNISVVITSPCNLKGLDADANNVNGVGFTISDNIGNKYILLNTQDGLLVGTYTFLFRAQELGVVKSTPNTITTIITNVSGVASVNNPQGAVFVGTNGESDAQLRTRQQFSPAQSSSKYTPGLQGRLLALEGVEFAKIIDNKDITQNANGVPPHSIWAIVLGGDPQEIAYEIYYATREGCGVYAIQDSTRKFIYVEDDQGILVPIQYNLPQTQIIYLKLELLQINNSSVNTSIIPSLVDYIVENCIFGIGVVASIGDTTPVVNDAINSLAPNQLTISSLELSIDGIAWVGQITPSNVNIQFAFITSNINITIT